MFWFCAHTNERANDFSNHGATNCSILWHHKVAGVSLTARLITQWQVKSWTKSLKGIYLTASIISDHKVARVICEYNLPRVICEQKVVRILYQSKVGWVISEHMAACRAFIHDLKFARVVSDKECTWLISDDIVKKVIYHYKVESVIARWKVILSALYTLSKLMKWKPLRLK